MDKSAVALGFLGFCKTDIILYFSRILHLLGESVAIIDKSLRQEIRYSVPMGLYTGNRIDYRGVEVFINCSGTETAQLPLSEYSVLLLDYGVNPDTLPELSTMKTLFVVTDGQRKHTLALSAYLSRITGRPDTIRIFRDMVPGKIRPRYIDSILQLEQTTNPIAAYEFPLNESEYAMRLHSQYDDFFHFAKCPDYLKRMLLECVTELFGTQRRNAVKAMKKAMRGG